MYSNSTEVIEFRIIFSDGVQIQHSIPNILHNVVYVYERTTYLQNSKILRKSYVTMVFDFNHFNTFSMEFNMRGWRIHSYCVLYYYSIGTHNHTWCSIEWSTENKWYLFTWRFCWASVRILRKFIIRSSPVLHCIMLTK